ncbi:MAG: hypothetical protein NTY15_01415, partial [Planctomycetota bacterium]|nr:hypothetical protein [Planctomycetota bacterium]
ACITMMMRAKSQDDTLFRSAYDLSKAAAQIASDLESATAHVSSSATHFEFVVPDRNGDGLPEQMRYEWGGTVGPNANKILWKYNQQPLEVLFEDVGEFSLQKNTALVPETVSNHLLSEIAVLKSVNAFPDAVFREQAINANNLIGQYFIPDITGSGVKWDLGTVRIMVRAAGANLDGILCVRVMRSNTSSKRPILPILEEVRIAESRLGTAYQWLDIPIAPVSWQSRGTPLCITLSYGGGTGDVAYVQYVENGSGMPSRANLVTSANGGDTWTASTNAKGLRFYAYGFYDGFSGQRAFLSSVDLKLGSSRLTSRKIETSARLPALPEIP